MTKIQSDYFVPDGLSVNIFTFLYSSSKLGVRTPLPIVSSISFNDRNFPLITEAISSFLTYFDLYGLWQIQKQNTRQKECIEILR
jgi:hypothetical protein